MQIEDFKDAVVTVMGLGRLKQGSGVGATKWLMRHGAQVIITDLKSEEELQESVDEVMRWYEQYRKDHPDREIYHPLFVLGEHREEDFTEVQVVLQNPDVPREDRFVALAREHRIPIFSDVSLFFQFCPFPIIGVTGTRGKTTTTTLIGEMAKRKDPRAVIAGNIKVSPLEYLDDILKEKESRPIVLELSSTLIESLSEVGRGPDIGVLTNLYPDHLNRYKTYEAYVQSKEGMFTMQTPHQIAIINKDNSDAEALGRRVPGKRFWFSKNELAADEEGAYVKDGHVILRREGKEEVVCSVSDIKLEGEHNLENVLAAVCAARCADVSVKDIADVLKTFAGVSERQEVIRTINDVLYVDDTTATSPEGAIAAMKRFGQKGEIVLLAGGSSKNLPFEGMVKMIHATCKYVVLFDGTATDELEAAIGDAVSRVRVGSMKEAVQVASKVAKAGDVVLLSPGCASFGMFKNEFDRGAQFKEEVEKL